jgi:hypothetical protein
MSLGGEGTIVASAIAPPKGPIAAAVIAIALFILIA